MFKCFVTFNNLKYVLEKFTVSAIIKEISTNTFDKITF